ncbi:MAG TPA: sensor histidine kinase [Firmicutes bacterium]|jgi:signal transduction histidine kinase|nr:sensor histidine kinase [Bacillota bacterium]
MNCPGTNFTTDEKTEITITRLLYLILLVGIVLVIAKNPGRCWLLLFLAGLLVTSITIRRAIIYDSARYLFLGKFNFILDFILIFVLEYNDNGFFADIFYLVLIIDASLAYSTVFTGGITLAGFILHGFERYIRFQQPTSNFFVSWLLIDLLIFLGTYILMIFIRYQIQQKEHLRQVMIELKIKTKELEKTYQKLKEAAMELEDITVLRERNRIAREIHDTVGHTLTTVLLELEAGERLIPLDPALATTKMELAKSQVRKGLNDIRASVVMLNSGHETLDFISSIKSLIHETMMHGDIHIRYQIDKLPLLTPQQEKALYHALQEGITNGIRHGKSTAFVFNLKKTEKWIEFFLQDNGGGVEQLTPGFGLTTMEERIKELGGIFSIDSKPREGCMIHISLPLQEVTNYAG